MLCFKFTVTVFYCNTYGFGDNLCTRWRSSQKLMIGCWNNNSIGQLKKSEANTSVGPRDISWSNYHTKKRPDGPRTEKRWNAPCSQRATDREGWAGPPVWSRAVIRRKMEASMLAHKHTKGHDSTDLLHLTGGASIWPPEQSTNTRGRAHSCKLESRTKKPFSGKKHIHIY